MWMNPKYGSQIQDYFGKVGPVVNRYGAKFPVTFEPHDGGGDYQPHTMGIAEWPNKAKNEEIFASTDFRNARHLRDAAVDRLDVFHAKVIVR